MVRIIKPVVFALTTTHLSHTVMQYLISLPVLSGSVLFIACSRYLLLKGSLKALQVKIAEFGWSLKSSKIFYCLQNSRSSRALLLPLASWAWLLHKLVAFLHSQS